VVVAFATIIGGIVAVTVFAWIGWAPLGLAVAVSVHNRLQNSGLQLPYVDPTRFETALPPQVGGHA
jgi:hypothetical protein